MLRCVSYQVIARKYRPQTFADLTGQEHITRTLGHALDGPRLHHAYLFSGARGTGKTTTARILAKGLNCHTGVSSRPCLQCPSCREVAAGNSIDVIEIDAASHTQVENVREVIVNNIAMAPARDRYKVFIIDEVHMLSNHSFNALLKTVEEPPPHVVFIMATTELHKVPDTILSRCQQFEFRHIPVALIFARLAEIARAEGVRATDAALREVARAGAGSLRDAQSALDQVIAFGGGEITEETVSAALGLVGARTLSRCVEVIADQQGAEILRLVEELVSRGYDLRNFTRELMAHLRHLLVVKSGITSGEVLGGVADVEVARLEELARRFSEEDLVRGFHLLAATEKEIKDSPHPRFQLELGLVRLTQVRRLRPLDELIARLEALEARLEGGAGGSGGGARPQPPPPPGDRRERGMSPLSGELPAMPPAKPPAKAAARPPAPPAPPPSAPPPPEPPPAPPPSVFDEPPDFGDFEPEAVSESVLEGAPAPPAKPGDGLAAIRAGLEQLNRQLLLTALEEAQSLAYEGGHLVVTFAGEDQFSRRVRDSGAIFRDLGERVFGRPISLEVKLSGGGAPPVDEAGEERARARERALENPTVRLLVEKFRGEVVEVRPKPAEP